MGSRIVAFRDNSSRRDWVQRHLKEWHPVPLAEYNSWLAARQPCDVLFFHLGDAAGKNQEQQLANVVAEVLGGTDTMVRERLYVYSYEPVSVDATAVLTPVRYSVDRVEGESPRFLRLLETLDPQYADIDRNTIGDLLRVLAPCDVLIQGYLAIHGATSGTVNPVVTALRSIPNGDQYLERALSNGAAIEDAPAWFGTGLRDQASKVPSEAVLVLETVWVLLGSVLSAIRGSAAINVKDSRRSDVERAATAYGIPIGEPRLVAVEAARRLGQLLARAAAAGGDVPCPAALVRDIGMSEAERPWPALALDAYLAYRALLGIQIV